MARFGPPSAKDGSKFAWSSMPYGLWPQKCHFNGRHDIMSKRRMASRDFGFVRYPPPYWSKYIVEPPEGTAAYASEAERLSSDVDGELKSQARKIDARNKEILNCHKNLRAFREYNLMCDRDRIVAKDQEKVDFFRKKPHGRILANKGAAGYNILTLKCSEGYDGLRLKYEEAISRWKTAKRASNIQAKEQGVRNYDVISWNKVRPVTMPEKPVPPVTPPFPKQKITSSGSIKLPQLTFPKTIINWEDEGVETSRSNLDNMEDPGFATSRSVDDVFCQHKMAGMRMPYTARTMAEIGSSPAGRMVKVSSSMPGGITEIQVGDSASNGSTKGALRDINVMESDPLAHSGLS